MEAGLGLEANFHGDWCCWFEGCHLTGRFSPFYPRFSGFLGLFAGTSHQHDFYGRRGVRRRHLLFLRISHLSLFLFFLLLSSITQVGLHSCGPLQLWWHNVLNELSFLCHSTERRRGEKAGNTSWKKTLREADNSEECKSFVTLVALFLAFFFFFFFSDDIFHFISLN